MIFCHLPSNAFFSSSSLDIDASLNAQNNEKKTECRSLRQATFSHPRPRYYNLIYASHRY